jgi:cadmium resistance protein CadD (predicted permease)
MTVPLPALLAAAVATFAVTNIDDLVLLAGWFSDGSYRARDIAVGQFLGIATLIGASALLGLAGLFVPVPIVGILGVIPAGIGISRLTRSRIATHEP